MNIRIETHSDYAAVERLTFAAFETMDMPGRTGFGSKGVSGKKKIAVTIRSSAAKFLAFVATSGENEQSFEMDLENAIL